MAGGRGGKGKTPAGKPGRGPSGASETWDRADGRQASFGCGQLKENDSDALDAFGEVTSSVTVP